MSVLKCERRSGYLVCYPYRRKVKRVAGKALAALGAVVFLLLLVYIYVDKLETSWPAQPVAEIIPQPTAQTIAETYSQTPEIKTSQPVQTATQTVATQTFEIETLPLSYRRWSI